MQKHFTIYLRWQGAAEESRSQPTGRARNGNELKSVGLWPLKQSHTHRWNVCWETSAPACSTCSE